MVKCPTCDIEFDDLDEIPNSHIYRDVMGNTIIKEAHRLHLSVSDGLEIVRDVLETFINIGASQNDENFDQANDINRVVVLLGEKDDPQYNNPEESEKDTIRYITEKLTDIPPKNP